jgi:hypothetical protein
MTSKCLKYSLNSSINKTKDVLNSQVLSDGRRTIAEDYLNGRINLHIHIGFDDEEFCATFDRDSPECPFRDVIEETTQNLEGTQDLSCEQQVSMLIKVAEFLQVPQVATFRARGTRLKRINDVGYCVADPLELTPLVLLVFGEVFENGEFIPNPRLITRRQDKFPDKVIKGTPIVVEHLPNAKTNLIGDRRHVTEAIDLISRSIVNIFGDIIEFEVTEGRQISANRIALLSGPGEF